MINKLQEIEFKIQMTELVHQSMEAGLSFGLKNMREEDFKEEYDRILKKLNLLL